MRSKQTLEKVVKNTIAIRKAMKELKEAMDREAEAEMIEKERQAQKRQTP